MKTAWVFPGQGSQVVGMGRDLYEASAAAREVFEEADATLGMPLTRICFEGPEEVLTATENAQPALLTMSTALLRALAERQGAPLPPPAAVAGHSLGEYSALVAGGALDFATALRLVRRRGELMAEAREGSMAAVIGMDGAALDEVCREVNTALAAHAETVSAVVVANYNAPDQLVISGSSLAVEQASHLARKRGAKRVLPLKVSAAFHSPLMVQAAEGMARAIGAVTVRDLRVPLIANVTAEPLLTAGDVRREAVAQVIAPVRWIASVQRMVHGGITTFLEVGPGKVLSGLIRRITPQAKLVNVNDAEAVRGFTQELEVEV
ncbi:MAG: [acyl-carrier-protein] S-malonyltransferase [Candidatus Viridilinea halotolerans]|uniref:Malonyl CoA-acyl carrier protein transacylase n=1 Tax=Candidatus Viridilinea halotolerans TaxID=2491704 RepID=A0A426TSU9_9CHLR|nr:MAG: [acyl-carrier-protein] S-malonyltransferase [Candidatus Viridilinea halotolerans]